MKPDYIQKDFIGRQNGSVTVLALLVMVILTLVGIGALTTSSTDIIASRNEDIYRENFARAEAAARRAMREIAEQNNDNLVDYGPDWLENAADSADIPDPNKDVDWTNISDNTVFDNDSQCRFYVVDVTFVSGTSSGSVSMGKDKRHEYAAWGRSTTKEGEVIIQVGYKRKLHPKF